MLLGFLWLLFIPNSIYILTDIYHFFWQFPLVDGILKILLIIQYLLLIPLGVIIFIVSFYAFEKVLLQLPFMKRKEQRALLLIATNFVIAFGAIIGRVQRINSWEVFTDIQKVIGSGIRVLTSSEQILFVVLLGLIANILYFSLRKIVVKFGVRKVRIFVK